MALLHRKPPAGLMFHSDRGVPYAAVDFRHALARAGLVASMSRRGNCYDHASMESLWSTLKIELVYRRRFPTHHRARTEIADSIGVFYDRERIHTALGGLSPTDFEHKNRGRTSRILLCVCSTQAQKPVHRNRLRPRALPH